MRRPAFTIRGLARDDRGIAAVEFGIIVVPLMIVLLGALDLGYQSYVRAQLQGVLNDVARTATVENPNFSGYTGASIEDRIENAIKERVNNIARRATYTVEQSSFYEFSGVGNAEKLLTDYNGNGAYDTGDCFEDINNNGAFDTDAGDAGRGGADDVVYYEVTITMPRLVPVATLIGVPQNYTITARTAVRNQPFADQAIPPTVCA
ncbi:TadE/TadG family type IV pilus assembly protein [Parasphingopyxis lamellibrachiae]|uniref:TadE-like protein n=1 Tax=Parasphingopyxis lamellibrachiae TaxID=680125 RepID=A0A3D9FCL5_9SPHN|nr:TadE/TadG family type IV pilus assembly protein [Parasphingopyxis lamellibrachiae]RED15545.1 TadE-like protein [Parasphingopyxis lamellibrachiae]